MLFLLDTRRYVCTIAMLLALLTCVQPLAAQPTVPVRTTGAHVAASPSRPAAKEASPGSVLEDPLVQYQAKRGLDLLYNMQFERASKLFDQIDRRYPAHPIGPFLKALNTWWGILLDLSDESHDEAFYAAMEEVIDRCDRMLAQDKNNFDAMFFKGAALGFRGRLRSNRGDWLKAATDGKRAMDYVLAVARKDPGNHDYVFGKGIYDYYAAVVPERYPFVKPVMVFFPNGDRERGLRALQRTAEHGQFIQTEAAYFLLQIYYLFEQDFEKSLYYVNWLRQQHPANPFFHTFEGRVYARWGHWHQAQQVFLSILEGYRQKKPGYNDASAEQSFYFLARAKMAYGEYEAALGYLQKLDALTARNAGDTYFKVWGRLRQGMSYDAMGQRDRAVALYRKVLKMKNWGDAHDYAGRYLETPHEGYPSPHRTVSG